MSTAMTEQEILDALVKAWNGFVSLEQTHGDDLPDFRRAIHECQRILAVRKLRRLEPDTWVTHVHPPFLVSRGENDDSI